MLKKLVDLLSQTDFARQAVAEQADLSMLKEKPVPRVIWGLVIVGISYAIGWPVIALLGLAAAYTKVPWIIVIGGPAAYLLSHLTFMLGAGLAGTHYARIFIRWATRLAVEKWVS